MASVSVGPGTILGERNNNGTTEYHWSFSATVNGQAGVFDFWLDTDDFSQASEYAQVFLEENPGSLGGVTSTDGTPDGDGLGDESEGDGEEEDGGDDDGGDGADTGGEGGIGESV